jgi:bifunctional UDP-N-acetylglucosamine pyrophosphorylase/glucosamine-1-phosphate N-acetyltransferase
MKTDLPKVAHEILGRPLLLWAMESMIEAGVKRIVAVISPQQEVVEKLLANYPFPADVKVKVAYQDVAKGTAHAARCAMPAVKEFITKDRINTDYLDVIIGFGDTPAVSSDSFTRYLDFHFGSKNVVTVLAFRTDLPDGYGRVVLNAKGAFERIREHKDCSAAERKVKLCNSGFLCAQYTRLAEYLPLVGTANASGEYYLTDVPRIAKERRDRVGVFDGIGQEELEGVNSQAQLAEMAGYLQRRILEKWMDQGVQFLNPDCVYVEPGVTFDSGVIIEPFVFLAGRAHIAKNTRVVAGSRMRDGRTVK